MKEEYRDIKGFPNYQVSNLGNVRNSKRTTRKINRLVVEAFLPEDPNRKDINHKDGNKKNNNVTNLERCTKSENMRHAFEHKLVKTEGRKPTYGMRGKKNPNGGAQRPIRVIETKKVYKNMAVCARELGIRDRSICDCLKGRQKSHHGYHFEYV